MPTTGGNGIRTVADIVQVLTKCSKEQADNAELEICKSPKAKATLAIACGISTAAIGAGGYLTIASLGTAGVSALPGLALIGVGGKSAARFCSSFVEKSTKY